MYGLLIEVIIILLRSSSFKAHLIDTQQSSPAKEVPRVTRDDTGEHGRAYGGHLPRRPADDVIGVVCVCCLLVCCAKTGCGAGQLACLPYVLSTKKWNTVPRLKAVSVLLWGYFGEVCVTELVVHRRAVLCLALSPCVWFLFCFDFCKRNVCVT